MAILEFNAIFPGQVSVKPRFVHILTDNSLAQVAAAGFLDAYVQAQSVNILASDFIFVSASDGNQIYRATIGASGSIDLNTLP